MPNVTITIGTPVLAAGEHFKIRYRLLPNGSFSAPQNKTNAPFTLTGLTAGSYELEVIVVKADCSECPPAYQIFEVVTLFTCIDFTVTLVLEANGLTYLQISYSLPGGWIDPACGWDIVYNGNTVHYAALPASPIKILVPNVTTQVQIVADGCNGNKKLCYTGTVPPAIPTCTPTFFTGYTIQPTSLSTFNSPEFLLTVNFTQSTPCTTSVFLIINQGPVTGGLPVSIKQSIPVACSSTSFSFIFKPNPNVQMKWDAVLLKEYKAFDFAVGYVDGCNKAVAVGTVIYNYYP